MSLNYINTLNEFLTINEQINYAKTCKYSELGENHNYFCLTKKTKNIQLKFVEILEILKKSDKKYWINFGLQKDEPLILDFAYNNGCNIDCNTYVYAAKQGSIKCLKYLFNKKWIDDDRITLYAAIENQLECLKYSYKKIQRFNRISAQYAASKGNYECLKYIIENGGIMNDDCCYYASTNGHYECLVYCHQKGGLLNSGIYKDVYYYTKDMKQNDWKKCLDYLISVGITT